CEGGAAAGAAVLPRVTDRGAGPARGGGGAGGGLRDPGRGPGRARRRAGAPEPPAGYAVGPRARAMTGTSARNARPRWLIASFSSGDISAVVRVSPSGTKIGS